MKKKAVVAAVSVVSVIIVIFAVYSIMNYFNKAANAVSAQPPQKSETGTTGAAWHKDGNPLIPPEYGYEVPPKSMEVKGIYLTGNSAGLESRFNNLINLINTTELNSMVIDVLDDYGEVSYKSSIQMVNEIGADKVPKIRDIHSVIDTLDKNNIYPIARIVTFKDSIAANARPDLALKTKDGAVWKDYAKNSWLNPYNKDSWEYPISVAEEAADIGFKEIQFDYVRFPTDGDRSQIDYGQASQGKTMAQAISEFLSYAREKLHNKGVVVSADIYGLVTTVKDDMGIGQHWEDVAASADVICPMVYPSHFAYGSYGIKYPDLEPYNTVYDSLSRGVQRIADMPADVSKAKIRPWLQDFTASWLKPKGAYKEYTADDVKAQIKAAYDCGLKEWILWNPGNKYDGDAFIKQ